MGYSFGITLDELYRAIGRVVYEPCIVKKSLARSDECGVFPTPFKTVGYTPAGGSPPQNFSAILIACEGIVDAGEYL